MIWDTLCDFTHGGTIQVKVRASTVVGITKDFKVDHVASLLAASAATALLAGVGLAAVAENDEVVTKLLGAFKAIYVQAA